MKDSEKVECTLEYCMIRLQIEFRQATKLWTWWGGHGFAESWRKSLDHSCPILCTFCLPLRIRLSCSSDSSLPAENFKLIRFQKKFLVFLNSKNKKEVFYNKLAIELFVKQTIIKKKIHFLEKYKRKMP